MPRDKSLFYYGRPYRLIDSLMQPHWSAIMDLVPAGSSVLDVGCGTGELAQRLHASRGCRVVGVDLSLRMVRFAQSRNPYPSVTFLHRDATDLQDVEGQPFDVAVLCQLLHELPREVQLRALAEATRMAPAVILLDHAAPMPRHVRGFVARLIEATIGRDHYRRFRAYLEAGGLGSIVGEAGLQDRITQRLAINQGCQQILVLA